MAKKKDDSWVRIYRSLMTHKIWTQEPFTHGQAWVDLIMMVSFKDTTNVYRGQTMNISRGSICTSLDYLAKRWHRTKKWVRGTLNMLKTLGMVTTIGTKQGTIITIENYASFQSVGHTKGHKEGTTEGTTEGTHNKNVIKNVINNNKADGSDPTYFESVAPPPDGERYVKVRNYQTGKVLIYDNQEERYVDG